MSNSNNLGGRLFMGKRQLTLNLVFGEFIVSLLGSLIIAVTLPIIVFMLGVNCKAFHTADYYQNLAIQTVQKIEGSSQFSKSQIPSDLDYAIFKNGKLQKNNLTHKILKYAAKYQKNAINTSKYHFLAATNKNNKIVIYYQIHTSYNNKKLNYYLAPPEKLLLWLAFILLIISCWLNIHYFARRIKRQLVPVEKAITQIEQKNLNFTSNSSQIMEINQIIASLNTMKNSLKQALMDQWNSESQQRNKTATLSHDLRTPLTVILGNADLLKEESLTTEQRQELNDLTASAEIMEEDLDKLISLSKNRPLILKNEQQKILLCDFMKKVTKEILPLIKLKHLNFEFDNQVDSSNQISVPIELRRVVVNIFSNAVDFCPSNGKINLKLLLKDNILKFVINTNSTDNNCNRLNNKHFGLGLPISNQIIKKYHGNIEFIQVEKSNITQSIINLPIEKTII
ncbi:sensor histidine kinase [Bombilactobacillus bombi]|nr:sensor histidine kinase [Bombilactobacillus bombi]